MLDLNNLVTVIIEADKVRPKYDLCCCSNCQITFKVSDCEADFGHHDGWEMPPYTVHICPNCEDGGSIDDYWYSNPGEVTDA